MAVNYTVNWTDDSLKPPFTLPGATINNTTTSLKLTGKATVNWGEPLLENMVRLLESFASKGVPPSNPTIGQVWYDWTANKLHLYTKDLVWVEVWPHPI